jgi:molybdopterin synthase catalytic subunit
MCCRKATRYHCFRRCREAEAIYELRFTNYDVRAACFHAARPTPHVLVTRELIITTELINEAALISQRRMSAGMGAVINFLGVVRASEDGKTISAIEYEAFEKMVIRQFNLLFDEMEKRWPVESVRLVHRVGLVKVNEPSLWVEIVAPHRGEAFAACQWLIDELKRVVPIWKHVRP